MSEWSYAIYDTITGALQLPVTPSSGTWARAMNATSSGSHVFQLSDPAISMVDFRSLTTPWSRVLVVVRNGVPVHAGVITKRVYDYGAKTLTVSHSDIRALLARRTTFGVNGYSGDTTDNKLVLTNLSYPAIVANLIWSGTIGAAGNFSLPIIIPSRTTVGTFSRSYFDYNFTYIDDAMNEVQNTDGGPDIDLEAQFSSSNRLQWEARVGDLTGTSYDFNMTAVKPKLFGISVTDDASKQATNVYAVGSGSEMKMRVRSAHITTVLPALERHEKYENITNLTDLQGHANADLALFQQPTSQLELSMLADAKPGKPGVDQLRMGSIIRLYFKNDPWFPDGWQPHRLIGMSGNMTETVKLSVQPTGGA